MDNKDTLAWIQLLLYLFEVFCECVSISLLSTAIFICIRANSFHSYFRALLLVVLLVLLCFCLIDVLNPISAAFPNFAESFSVPTIRWWCQSIAFQLVSVVFFLISIERCFAVSFCTAYQQFNSSLPVFIFFLCVVISTVGLRYLLYYYALKMSYFCFALDCFTLCIMTFLWRKNEKLKKKKMSETLNTKYQLSENARVARLLLPIIIVATISKAACTLMIWTATRVDELVPHKTLFLTIYRILMNLFASICAVLLMWNHVPYRKKLYKILFYLSGRKLQYTYEDTPVIKFDHGNNFHFEMLRKQWGEPTIEPSSSRRQSSVTNKEEISSLDGGK